MSVQPRLSLHAPAATAVALTKYLTGSPITLADADMIDARVRSSLMMRQELTDIHSVTSANQA